MTTVSCDFDSGHCFSLIPTGTFTTIKRGRIAIPVTGLIPVQFNLGHKEN
jgi:hypothetical protein